MRKVVILAILFIIALVFLGYFVISKGLGDKTGNQFKGPSGEPYVKGPSGLPPGASY